MSQKKSTRDNYNMYLFSLYNIGQQEIPYSCKYSGFYFDEMVGEKRRIPYCFINMKDDEDYWLDLSNDLTWNLKLYIQYQLGLNREIFDKIRRHRQRRGVPKSIKEVIFCNCTSPTPLCECNLL